METHTCENGLSETFKGRHRGGLLWKINNFTVQRSCVEEKFLTSQIFKIQGMDDISWTVRLYPRGIGAERIKVYLFLNCVGQEPDFFINCDFALVAKTGQKMFPITIAGSIGCEDFQDGTYLEPEINFSDEEKELLLPNDVLTVSCVLTIKDDQVVSHGGSVLVDTNLNTLKNDFAKLFEEKQHTDVVLKVGELQISAHKVVLACRSAVFSSMFEHDMQEKKTKQVDVVDVEYDVLCSLVRFLYTDQADFSNVSFALKLLMAANKYDVSLLTARCTEYLEAEISENNVFEICVVADGCDQLELKQRCVQFIRSEMSSVTSLAEWISQIKSYPQALDFVMEYLHE